MFLHKIEPSNTEMLRRILTLHDQMPLEWDHTHQPSQKFTETLLQQIQTTEIPRGFWILSAAAVPSTDSVAGLLWASIKKDRAEHVYASINSLWIHPEHRRQNFTPLLTKACTLWAREQGARYLSCTTHFNNARMRNFLEKTSLKPVMLEFRSDILT